MATDATSPYLLLGGKSLIASTPQVVFTVIVSRGWLEILI